MTDASVSSGAVRWAGRAPGRPAVRRQHTPDEKLRLLAGRQAAELAAADDAVDDIDITEAAVRDERLGSSSAAVTR